MKKFIKIMTGFMNRMTQDHVSAFAAQAAFFILMSFVPFLMLLLPLVTYVSITKDMVVEILLQIMPDAGDFRSFLFSIIQEVYDKSTAIVPISAVFTLWSAGKGLQGLTNGVNAIYHVKETRNYVVTRIRSAQKTQNKKQAENSKKNSKRKTQAELNADNSKNKDQCIQSGPYPCHHIISRLFYMINRIDPIRQSLQAFPRTP